MLTKLNKNNSNKKDRIFSADYLILFNKSIAIENLLNNYIDI